MRDRSAFTLIELLIVVAIIAILAAIAVPNFLEAQTRAKVSRARADLRTMATAVESYRIDWNFYPPDNVRNLLAAMGLSTAESFFPPILSTPVAYITTAQIQDPFVSTGIPIPTDDLIYRTLFYQNVTTSRAAALGDPGWDQAYQGFYQVLGTGAIMTSKVGQGWGSATFDWTILYGTWKMGSVGPDRDYNGGANMYDPTNGTVSSGDIYRTQLLTEGGRLGLD